MKLKILIVLFNCAILSKLFFQHFFAGTKMLIYLPYLVAAIFNLIYLYPIIKENGKINLTLYLIINIIILRLIIWGEYYAYGAHVSVHLSAVLLLASVFILGNFLFLIIHLLHKTIRKMRLYKNKKMGLSGTVPVK